MHLLWVAIESLRLRQERLARLIQDEPLTAKIADIEHDLDGSSQSDVEAIISARGIPSGCCARVACPRLRQTAARNEA
jgi:hypothetical protein